MLIRRLWLEMILKIESIKRFIALRDKINRNVTVTLQVTFLKSIVQHLEEIIKFAIDIGADRLRGISSG